jgi:mono/diheme cytochrome c family protein
LVDDDGDGRADAYETVADDWTTTDNWHEHAFGLHRDAAGRFVVAFGLTDTAGPINMLWPRRKFDFKVVAGEAKLSLAPYQGWVVKITPEGRVEPWACGFREPCGVGVSPDGEVFITDQQGDYIGSSPLIHVEQGKFYGHPASLKWDPARGDRPWTIEQLAAERTPPTVVLPHGALGGSPGEPVWDVTGGKFGPFAGQVFIGDFTKLISRVDLQRVDGRWQGVCFPFLRDAVDLVSAGGKNLTVPAGAEGSKYFRNVASLEGTPLRQGNMRMAFAPDGALYLGQTTRGWAGGDGLQRIVWNGETPVDIATMRLTRDGFRLRFTVPMDRDPLSKTTNYRLGRFRYLYHRGYGSPRIDAADVTLREVRVDGAGQEAELVVDALEPGFIYELETANIAAVDGRPLRHNQAWYTLNRTLDGRRFDGAVTSGELPPEATAEVKPPDAKRGQKVYGTFCINCHRADGRGGGLPGIGPADFTRVGGVMKKTDDELAARVADGVPGKTMPPFGFVLSKQQIVDALAYIRTTFAPKSHP